MSICIVCRKEFSAYHLKKTCSTICKIEYDRKKWRETYYRNKKTHTQIPETKLCQACGKTFTSSNWRLKTCSDKCSKEFKLIGLKRRRKTKKISLMPVLCVICDKKFIPTSKRNITCSKTCQYERKKIMTKTWSKINYKEFSLRKNYNLSLDEMENILKKQRYKCAICEETLEKPHIDHDHKTGKIRGILCFNCNTAIGKFGDDPNRLMKAIIYLSKNKEEEKIRKENINEGTVSTSETRLEDGNEYFETKVFRRGGNEVG